MKYGLTTQDLNLVRKKQRSCYAICRRAKLRLVKDHDHATGKFRGLLCAKCNFLLGHADDNTRVLLAAVDYLIEHGKPGILKEVA